MKSQKKEVLAFVKKQYKTEPDTPWPKYPDDIVLRHDDNKKWYAIMMTISGKYLGLDEKEYDVINVKISDQILRDLLLQQDGYFPAYHMNKKNWITVILDGRLDFGEICERINESFNLTASKKQWEKIRPNKEWLIPANPKYYDVEAAFANNKVISWKQSAKMKTGDTVYMYVAAPVSAILYKCKVLETDIPYKYADKNLSINKLMNIELVREYDRKRFTLDVLKENFEIFYIRGPRSIPEELSEALKR